MVRVLTIAIEHVAGDTFRAILLEHEGQDRQVFDIIEGRGADLPGHLRHRKKPDGLDWNAAVKANWVWYGGKARRYDALAKRAIASFAPAPTTGADT